MEPDPGGIEWVERVRSLHGLWVVAEGNGEMPGGGAATTLMTLGYDPRRQSYVGHWVGSMMPHLWVYEGRLDDSGKVLTIDCEGLDFKNVARLSTYTDLHTIKSPTHPQTPPRL